MTTPSGGWGNPVVGGVALRQVAIESPNFVHGVSGWDINQDGSAEFQDIILPTGVGGSVVTFGPTPPSNPKVGDLWIQI